MASAPLSHRLAAFDQIKLLLAAFDSAQAAAQVAGEFGAFK